MGAIIVQLGSARRHAAPGRLGAAAKLPFYTTEPPQFANPVHCVRQTRDGLLYVCDRANNRIQVFRKNGQFVRHFTLEPKTLGSAWDLIPIEDAAQKYPQVAGRKNPPAGCSITILMRRSYAGHVTLKRKAGLLAPIHLQEGLSR